MQFNRWYFIEIWERELEEPSYSFVGQLEKEYVLEKLFRDQDGHRYWTIDEEGGSSEKGDSCQITASLAWDGDSEEDIVNGMIRDGFLKKAEDCPSSFLACPVPEPEDIPFTPDADS